jgi:DNA-binding CsgD family transcriptional regulator
MLLARFWVSELPKGIESSIMTEHGEGLPKKALLTFIGRHVNLRLFAFSTLIATYITTYYHTSTLIQQTEDYFTLGIVVGMCITMLFALLVIRVMPCRLGDRFWMSLSLVANLVNITTNILTEAHVNPVGSGPVGLLFGICLGCTLLCWVKLSEQIGQSEFVITLSMSFLLVLTLCVCLRAFDETFAKITIVLATMPALSLCLIMLLQRRLKPVAEYSGRTHSSHRSMPVSRILVMFGIGFCLGTLQGAVRTFANSSIYEFPGSLYLLTNLIVLVGFFAVLLSVSYRAENRQYFIVCGILPPLTVLMLGVLLKLLYVLPLLASLLLAGTVAFVLGTFHCLILFALERRIALIPIFALGALSLCGGTILGHFLGLCLLLFDNIFVLYVIFCALAPLACAGLFLTTLIKSIKWPALPFDTAKIIDQGDLNACLDVVLQRKKVKMISEKVDAIRKANFCSYLAEQGLSPRQIEVSLLTLKGRSVAQISDELFIAPVTVRNHLAAIYRGLNIHSSRELAALYERAKEK